MTQFNAEDYATLATAAEEIARINLQIAELQEMKDMLLGAFKNENNGLVASSVPYDFGKVEVKVSANSRLDDGLAQRNLSKALYNDVTKTTLDTAKARKLLGDEELELITKKYDNKIEVRLK